MMVEQCYPGSEQSEQSTKTNGNSSRKGGIRRQLSVHQMEDCIQLVIKSSETSIDSKEEHNVSKTKNAYFGFTGSQRTSKSEKKIFSNMGLKKRFPLPSRKNLQEPMSSTSKPATQMSDDHELASCCYCDDEATRNSAKRLLKWLLFSHNKKRRPFANAILHDEDKNDDWSVSDLDDYELTKTLQPLYKPKVSSSSISIKISDGSSSFEDSYSNPETSRTASTANLTSSYSDSNQSPSSLSSLLPRQRCIYIDNFPAIDFSSIVENDTHLSVYGENLHHVDGNNKIILHSKKVPHNQNLHEDIKNDLKKSHFGNSNELNPRKTKKLNNMHQQKIYSHGSCREHTKEERASYEDYMNTQGACAAHHHELKSACQRGKYESLNLNVKTYEQSSNNKGFTNEEGTEVVWTAGTDCKVTQKIDILPSAGYNLHHGSSNHTCTSRNSISIAEDIAPDSLFKTAWDFYDHSDDEQFDDATTVSNDNTESLLNSNQISHVSSQDIQQLRLLKQTEQQHYVQDNDRLRTSKNAFELQHQHEEVGETNCLNSIKPKGSHELGYQSRHTDCTNRGSDLGNLRSVSPLRAASPTFSTVQVGAYCPKTLTPARTKPESSLSNPGYLCETIQPAMEKCEFFHQKSVLTHEASLTGKTEVPKSELTSSPMLHKYTASEIAQVNSNGKFNDHNLSKNGVLSVEHDDRDTRDSSLVNSKGKAAFRQSSQLRSSSMDTERGHSTMPKLRTSAQSFGQLVKSENSEFEVIHDFSEGCITVKKSFSSERKSTYYCASTCAPCTSIDRVLGLHRQKKEAEEDKSVLLGKSFVRSTVCVPSSVQSSLLSFANPKTIKGIAESEQQTASALLNNVSLFETIQELAWDGSFLMRNFVLKQHMQSS